MHLADNHCRIRAGKACSQGLYELTAGRYFIRRELIMRKKYTIWLGIVVFLAAFGAGAISKVAIKPSWVKDYSAKWSDEIGTLTTDLPYGEGDEQKFDLYLPKDNSGNAYGLAVYLHAGGFTQGDKAGDWDMLAWLCKKSYVAAGINYTLARDLGKESSNGASVYTQSNEIKALFRK